MSLRNVYILIGLIILTSCQAVPRPTGKMVPNNSAINSVKTNFYLKNKLTVGEVQYHWKNKSDEHLFDNARNAFLVTLTKSGFVASNPSSAKYIISASIIDITQPRCKLTECSNTSSIEYKLIDLQSKRLAYKETLVVPYTNKFSYFDSNISEMTFGTMTESIAENYARLVHTLSEKNETAFNVK